MDARTDLFSFGLLLYDMATGWHTLSDKVAAVIHDAVGQGSAVRQSGTELPEELGRIISKATQVDRNLRYQSAAEMRANLKQLKRETESTRGTGIPVAPAKSRPWWRRETILAAGGVVLAVLLVSGTWFALSRGQDQVIDSVAVLPFVNAGSDPNLDYLADGVTEGLIKKRSSPYRVRTKPKSSRLSWARLKRR